MRPSSSVLALVVMVWMTAPPRSPAADDSRAIPALRLLDVPDVGIQPQAAVDDRGAIHAIYFQGDPAGGDLFYTRREPGADAFSKPVRVNSQPGSAIAIGTIRGGQIAIGRGGRVHVAWNGSGAARPLNPAGGSPMLHARSDPEGKTFEPQRNLMQRTSALDGGGTVAADRDGNVYVAWHGRTESDGPGEAHRRIWVARSSDDGATFAAEEPALGPDRETGACGCCGIRALAARDGTLYILYRAATGGADRDMYLIHSEDHAAHFDGGPIDRWKATTCPMSSAALAESDGGVLAAWETRGQVAFARVDPRTHRTSPPIAPEGGRGDRKHPTLAGNARGDVLLAWTEGTGWKKGGSLAWQVLDRDGRPRGGPGHARDAVLIWDLAAAVARPDGGFAIVTSRGR